MEQHNNVETQDKHMEDVDTKPTGGSAYDTLLNVTLLKETLLKETVLKGINRYWKSEQRSRFCKGLPPFDDQKVVNLFLFLDGYFDTHFLTSCLIAEAENAPAKVEVLQRDVYDLYTQQFGRSPFDVFSQRRFYSILETLFSSSVFTLIRQKTSKGMLLRIEKRL